ncbi:hypothetical protein ABTL68_19765, partial [Acinetobacter baumannii]
DRFLAALERSTDASLRTGAARTQQRGDAPASGDPSILREPAPPLGSAGLTQAVLGIAHDGAENVRGFGGADLVETAVFSLK